MRLYRILISGFLVIALLVSVVGFVSLSQLGKIRDSLIEDIPGAISHIKDTSKLDGQAQFIRYYDEVLTMSARNYAFTQDKKWETRYMAAEPELDYHIKVAIEEGDEEDKELFSSVDAANIALVEMEYNSIEFVNKGEAEKAVEILESDEYWIQKDIYQQRLIDYVERRGSTYDKAFEASTVTLESVIGQTGELVNSSRNLIISFIVIALVLSISMGLFISYSISRPLSKLTNTVDEISKGNFKIEIETQGEIDEVNKLSESLNRIMKTMKLAVLEKKVKK